MATDGRRGWGMVLLVALAGASRPDGPGPQQPGGSPAPGAQAAQDGPGASRRDVGAAADALHDRPAADDARMATEFYRRGVDLQHEGRHREAVEALSRALEAMPGAITYAQRGLSRAELGESQRAADDFTRAIEIDPSYALATAQRGLARQRLGDVNGALADFGKAIQLDARDPIAYRMRGELWLRLGRLSKAVDDLGRAIELAPGYALARTQRGMAWSRLGAYDKAIDDLTEAIRLDSGSTTAYAHRGEARLGQGLAREALVDLSRAIELNPADDFALAQRGLAWNRLGAYDSAIKDLTEAIRIGRRAAFDYEQRANAFLQTGRYDEAIADLDEVIRRDPKNDEAYSRRGFAWLRKGDRDQALTDMTRAVEIAREWRTTVGSLLSPPPSSGGSVGRGRAVSGPPLPAGPIRNDAVKQAPVDRSTRVVLLVLATPTLGDPRPDIQKVKDFFARGVEAANGGAKGKLRGQDGFVVYQDLGAVLINKETDVGFLDQLIREQDVDDATTFVFYYRGHAVWLNQGGPDVEEPSHHLITLDAYDKDHVIRRTDLLAKLRSKPARLTVLLTECCSVQVTQRPAGVKAYGGEARPTLFEELFLKPRGVVDITSSTFRVVREPGREGVIDEASWVSSEGGVFTNAFSYLGTLKNPHAAIDKNGDGAIGWDDFFLALRDQTIANYRLMKDTNLAKYGEDKAEKTGLGIPVVDPEWVSALGRQEAQTPRAFPSPVVRP